MSDSDGEKYIGPDPRIDGDLMDETWEPTEEDLLNFSDLDEPAVSPKRLSFLQVALAVLALLGLISIVFGNVIDVFQLPSLDFLQQSRQLHQEPVIQNARNAVVQIHAVGRSPAVPSQGTGFNIDPSGVIVTNRHVIQGANVVSITFWGGQTMYAREWVLHPHADLAVIRLQTQQQLPFLSIQPRLPAIGTTVFLIGNPLGFSHTAMQGTVRSYAQTSGPSNVNLTVMEIEAPIHPGNSGSPIFDQNGAVVGVVYAQLVSPPNLPLRGLAIPIREVHDLLHP